LFVKDYEKEHNERMKNERDNRKKTFNLTDYIELDREISKRFFTKTSKIQIKD